MDDCYSNPNQYTHFFTCSDGRCIDEYRLCNGKKDCVSGEDETVDECIYLYNEIPPNLFPCTKTGYLINSDQVREPFFIIGKSIGEKYDDRLWGLSNGEGDSQLQVSIQNQLDERQAGL